MFLVYFPIAILFAVIILIFGKILAKSKAFVIGFCVILLFSFVVLGGVFLNCIVIATEDIYIEATGEKSEFAKSNEIALVKMSIDGKSYEVRSSSKGNWFWYDKENSYMWRDENDVLLKETLTKEIMLKIPVGADRKLVFLNNPYSGIVKVTYRNESKQYDLYSEDVKNMEIIIPNSNTVYSNFIKLLKLGIYYCYIFIIFAFSYLAVTKLEKNKAICLLCNFLSVITILTINLNLDLKNRSGVGIISFISDFTKSYKDYSVITIILLPLISKMFKKSVEFVIDKMISVKSILCMVLPASFFALFMVLGYSFYKSNSLNFIFENELQIAKSIVVFTGYFSFFFFCIAQLFSFADRKNILEGSKKILFKPIQFYLNCLNKRPFLTALITLITLYIPYIIAYYPALLVRGDSLNQIRQAYNAEAFSYYKDLISENVKLTNHHPVMHTLLIKWCMKLGYKITGSVNIGLFFYSILQFILVSTVVSLAIKQMMEIGISQKIQLAILIYFVFHPMIQIHMFLMTKDVIDAAFLLTFILFLYRIFVYKRGKTEYLILTISILGTLLFRNEGVYIITISLLFLMLFIKEHRKKLGMIAVYTICFSILWNLCLLPLFKVTPGGKREMLSLPFQQTARYVRDAKEDITEKEKEGILAILDYEHLAEKYNPNLADPVKSTYKERSASLNDLKNYLLIWFQMFFKHPGIYIQATLNNKYEYFYPTLKLASNYSYSWTSKIMEEINEVTEFPGKLYYPQNLNSFRTGYETLRNSLFKIPIINILYVTATYIWILIIWFAYCIDKKNKIAMALVVPLLTILLILMVGPCNGSYFRYMYPCVICLPIVIILGLHSIQCDKRAEDTK